jgi:hypothetical protein
LDKHDRENNFRRCVRGELAGLMLENDFKICADFTAKSEQLDVEAK